MFSSLLPEVLTIVRRPRHTALCVRRHLLLRWKTGKVPVLGGSSRSCSACSYLGRAAALCRFLKAEQSGPTGAKSLSQIPDVPLSCWALLGIFRREGILDGAAPAKPGLAPSPYPLIQLYSGELQSEGSGSESEILANKSTKVRFSVCWVFCSQAFMSCRYI